MGIEITLSDINEICTLISNKFGIPIEIVFVITVVILLSYFMFKHRNFFLIYFNKIATIIKQILNFGKLTCLLWIISKENSKNYKSMIDFRPYNGSIKADDNNPSPYLDFSYSIPNLSIFDFKTKKIAMHAFYKEYELIPPIEINEKMEITHQTHHNNGHVKHPLQQNFIDELKLLKSRRNECFIEIIIRDVIIDFGGAKEFRKSWEPPLDERTEFVLKIPMGNIYISLLQCSQ